MGNSREMPVANINKKRKVTEVSLPKLIDECEMDSFYLGSDRQHSCPHLAKFLKFCWGLRIYERSVKVFVPNQENSKRQIRAYNYRCFAHKCTSKSRLHLCLFCSVDPVYCFGCHHSLQHFNKTDHNLAMEVSNGYVYCFKCDDYVFDDFLTQSLNLLNMTAWQNENYFVLDTHIMISEEGQFNAFAANFLNDQTNPSYGLRGLVNLGSTCFMNCIVQTLVHTPILRDYFVSHSHTCEFVDKNQCLVCALDKIFQEFYSGSKEPYIPVSLLHLVWRHARHLAGYEQQDAHEFFISSLDILHRHSSGKTDLTMNKGCTCFIDRVFSGSLQSDVCCMTCGGISSKEDPIWDFSLDLVDHMEDKKINSTSTSPFSLLDCLQLFTRTEHLGSSAKIKCNNCQTNQESTKKMSLKSLPHVASFHLKRFEQTANRFNKKITSFISFPMILDMTPFTTAKIGYNGSGDDVPAYVGSNENKYFLFAVVNHTGTLETGHYTAFIRKHLSDQWFKCDDHFVIRATEREVLDSQGYLLFYQKFHPVILSLDAAIPRSPSSSSPNTPTGELTNGSISSISMDDDETSSL